ncbi:MAG: hypothetical protein K6C98_10705 [Treponema sp.]|nr:hypothetical protein [Treponema sp.]
MQDGSDVFSEEMLNVIDRLGMRLRNKIPFADRLTSIIDVDIPVGNEEGFEVVKPFERGIPSDPEELKAKRDFIMRGTEKTNSLINSLVSDDGKETWLNLSLLPFEGELLETEFEGDIEDMPLIVGYKFMDIIESPEF